MQILFRQIFEKQKISSTCVKLSLKKFINFAKFDANKFAKFAFFIFIANRIAIIILNAIITFFIYIINEFE